MISLVRPSIEYRESYLEALAEHREEGMYTFLSNRDLEEDFEKYVDSLLVVTPSNPAFVPQTVYWGVDENGYAGRLALRHALNERLQQMGGHIGYDVRPSRRRRGYATQMVRLVLPEAAALGLERVLITCDDDNEPSCRTAQAVGAILEKTDSVPNYRKQVRYYWLEIPRPATTSVETP